MGRIENMQPPTKMKTRSRMARTARKPNSIVTPYGALYLAALRALNPSSIRRTSTWQSIIHFEHPPRHFLLSLITHRREPGSENDRIRVVHWLVCPVLAGKKHNQQGTIQERAIAPTHRTRANPFHLPKSASTCNLRNLKSCIDRANPHSISGLWLFEWRVTHFRSVA